MLMATAENPILNAPYAEPERHYATDIQGNLNYKDVRDGRRVFTPDVPQVPLAQQTQGSMFDLNDLKASMANIWSTSCANKSATWRQSGYRGITSRVTRDLLTYWFANPERRRTRNCFSPSRKPLKRPSGSTKWPKNPMAVQHILNQLRQRQATAGDNPADQLPRFAFKMATGAAKPSSWPA